MVQFLWVCINLTGVYAFNFLIFFDLQMNYYIKHRITQNLFLLEQENLKNLIISYCLSKFLAACQVNFD